MEFVLDISPIQEFFSLPAEIVIQKLLINFGWLPVAAVLLWGFKEIWIYYIQDQWAETIKFTNLAIDIPRGNDQSLKAVENMFTYFAGAHSNPDLIERYWVGMFQLGFSFEIVSIEGYTQFLVRAPVQFRDLVESAVYSQYPDAEITEVNDYTENMPSKFPDDEYDIWGSEFILVKKYPYPLKTYRNFESPMAGKPETQFKDPMASLMDLYSSLRKGEQAWLQILVNPTGFDWVKNGEKEISKLLNEKVKESGIFEKIWNPIVEFYDLFMEQIFGWPAGGSSADAGQDAFKMFNLKPKEKKQLESIQEKISKVGFDCKIRFIYTARKDVMNKPKVVNGFVGYIKQFADLDLNNLKPDVAVTGTSASYFLKNYRLNERKKRIMSGYKKRSISTGRSTFILNIEELATLWHFPVEAVVKAPLIQKAPGRKAEPPMSLPIGEERIDEGIFAPSDNEDIFKDIDEASQKEKALKKNDQDSHIEKDREDVESKVAFKRGLPPSNLPIA